MMTPALLKPLFHRAAESDTCKPMLSSDTTLLTSVLSSVHLNALALSRSGSSLVAVLLVPLEDGTEAGMPLAVALEAAVG